jgi:hypothetical protein
MLASADPATFAAIYVTLYTAHQVGDHWAQTCHQAATKANPGWAGRNACAKHVASLLITKLVALLALVAVVDLPLSIPVLLLGLAVDAASHYWADRRSTLAALADRLALGGFYRLGAPRPGHDDNPSLGTGAYALDQSWHVAWLAVAALIIAAGA